MFVKIQEVYGKSIYKKLYRLAKEVNIVNDNDTYEIDLTSTFGHDSSIKMKAGNYIQFNKDPGDGALIIQGEPSTKVTKAEMRNGDSPLNNTTVTNKGFHIHVEDSTGAKVEGDFDPIISINSKGYEFEECDGLGLIPGSVKKIERTDMPIPHMGWNSLQIVPEDPIFKYFEDGEYVYYVHSFYAKDCLPSTLGTSQYGNVAVTGVVRNGNVYGTQFHPEKSGDAGLRLLKAFAEL